jgi:hypothetical protein
MQFAPQGLLPVISVAPQVIGYSINGCPRVRKPAIAAAPSEPIITMPGMLAAGRFHKGNRRQQTPIQVIAIGRLYKCLGVMGRRGMVARKEFCNTICTLLSSC